MTTASGIIKNPADGERMAWDDHIFMNMARRKRNHELHYTIHLIFPGSDSISEAHLFGTDYAAAERLRRQLLATGNVLYISRTMMWEIVERRRAEESEVA